MRGMNETPKHLVYGLIDPRTNELRYVGKSSTGMKRPRRHLGLFERTRRGHKGAWLRQLWADGEQVPRVLVLMECESDVAALSHEVRLISLFRDAGFDLTNLTDGGEGLCGYQHTEEARDKMSASRKYSPTSDETRAKMAEAYRIRREAKKNQIGLLTSSDKLDIVPNRIRKGKSKTMKNTGKKRVRMDFLFPAAFAKRLKDASELREVSFTTLVILAVNEFLGKGKEVTDVPHK